MYTPTFSRFRRHILVAVTSVFLSSCGGGEVANEADLSDNYLSSTMQHDDVLKEASLESRLASVPTVQAKPVVYQVFTRLFGNTNSTNKPWGTIDENGVGKFSDFTPQALKSIKSLGTSHIWFTGVPHHALISDYTEYGIRGDDPDVVKGRAGSPYAVKDYYNVNPDLADDPAKRLEEFEALVARTHEAGMKVIIDIVPNHVARDYESLSAPEGVSDFGAHDDTSVEYARDNNFYYVVGEAFEVPDGGDYKPLGGDSHPLSDGKFDEFPAKWTGNGARAAQPDINDWYETVKVNYGVRPDGTYDFPTLPEGFSAEHAAFWEGKDVPDSWYKFRDIAHYWLDKGVDGFRYDMAEMVPVEFWSFLNSSIKQKAPDAFLLAEVYQPGKYRAYIQQGKMDYLYDKVGFYDTLKTIMQGSGAVSDLVAIHDEVRDIAPHMLHFLENHDEQRIASPDLAGDADKGKPALAVSALISRAPTLLYFGQDVGEDGSEETGFGDPTRTTIFDYAGVPAHQRFMNNGKFDAGQSTDKEKALHRFYKDIMNIAATNSAITGRYQSLHALNLSVEGSAYSEQQFAFLREKNGQGIIVLANFSEAPTGPISLAVPASAIQASGNKLELKPLLSHDGLTLEQNEVNYRAITSLNALETKVFAF
ncbi:alpha-amylase family protein [Alteromonas australica]|uniref:alpha-amylase family protein n=1 Tax=Alteromonas australica TaxID=589873 RepID=UPI00235763CF|nr:alpha-amylase family protein [Alteromonas australica]|tara:strand:+ start:14173 stop:16116 length:1944 start_codon:yes stop_codon:yes gene_type:complete